MISKIRQSILLLLIFVLPSEAGPINWAKHHKRFLLAASAVTVGSIIQYKGTTYCSKGDVERCIEGYGSRRAFNWFSIGMGAAMIPLSEKCRNDDGPRTICWGLSYWVPTTQISFGIHDYLNYDLEKKDVNPRSRRNFAISNK